MTATELTNKLLDSIKAEKVTGKSARKGARLPVPPPKTARSPEQAAVAADISDKHKAFIADSVAKDSEKRTAKEQVAVEQAADDIPDFLLVKNRKPLTKKQQAEFDAKVAASRHSGDAHQAELRAKQKEIKAEKARVARDNKKAKANGSVTVPVTGKEAAKLIFNSKALGKANGQAAKPKGEQTRIKAAKAEKKDMPRKANRKPVQAKKRADGPSGMAEKIGALAARPQGASRAELIKLSGWAQQAWKWYFVNSKDNGFCQKWGYTLKVIEGKDGETRYKITKR